MSWCRFMLISLIPALLMMACSVPTSSSQPESAVVYVIHRGWHTDIGLPVQEIAGPLAILESGFPGVRFMTFGFGERQFVVDHDQSFVAMLQALLPSRSALLMTALRTTPAVAFDQSNVVALQVSPLGLARIEAAIWRELELGSNGQPMLLANGPYPGSVFYAARDTYSGLFTCNTWTAETLRSGGIAIPAVGVLFSSQVMGSVRWVGTHQAQSSGG